MTTEEIVKRLREESDVKSGSSFNNACPGCGQSSNLMTAAADRLEALEAEVGRLRVLVRSAYFEGFSGGKLWCESAARAALEGEKS